MTGAAATDWEPALAEWLSPFLEALGHKVRQRWAPVYVRGLLGPGERKSVQPMAARVAPADCDQLHHFISSAAWQAAPLAAVLAREADRLVGGADAVLIIDDTALPKKGEHSVGVARQYAGVLGKTANCQALVSLTLARGDVPVPVALQLYLPKAWCRDRKRCAEAGVPAECRVFRSKGAIALDELDRLRAAGVRFGCVLADAGYGSSAAFRRSLAARAPLWAVGIPKTQRVYSAAVQLRWPAKSATGRPRRHGIPNERPVTAAAALQRAPWRRIAWRQGTKGPLTARFAARRVRVADGPQSQTGHRLPGPELWLVGEWRSSGERKYYLASHPAGTALQALAATIKARWVCEQAHQQMKEELGLDHFEGRGWHGLHHHALMVLIAFAFLQHLRLRQSGQRGKNPRHRSATPTDLARRSARVAGSPRRHRPTAMSQMPRDHRPAQARMKVPK
jgi:SRSO17 transposase